MKGNYIPVKSQRQFKFMQMMAHNPEKAKKKGMTPAAAKEYTSHNKGSMAYKNLPTKK
jgi:hypothetical protein